ncbi:MAG: SDR family NAD(P)-dependent oxidoreductase [Actinomycetota bacterium]|nr:SDR family NAD(P)-dependent oxidoreductase [Actinomycetota bacterium]
MENGSVAVVTGGGSGVGSASAQKLCELGWQVVVCGRRIEPLRLLSTAFPNIHSIQADVSIPDDVNRLFAETVSLYGRVDLLFNNAGRGTLPVAIDELPVQDWLATVAVNLTGSWLCSRAAFAQMKSQSPIGGRIINNGSVSAHTPRPLSSPYTATKHAITGLTKALSLEGRNHHIAVGQIDIGNAFTPLTEAMAHGALQPSGESTPEALMDVEHVAEAIGYMASLPLDSNVLNMTVMANSMPFVGRG